MSHSISDQRPKLIGISIPSPMGELVSKHFAFNYVNFEYVQEFSVNGHRLHLLVLGFKRGT